MITDPHKQLLDDCLSGHSTALEDLIKIFQPKIFSLALKFLWEPDDASDATQEILIKVITHLGSFRKEAKLSTWIYRIATNHLINAKKKINNLKQLRFRQVEKQLSLHNQNQDQNSNSSNLPFLIYNIQMACTNAMLLCLSKNYRIAYILGEVFRVSSDEGAWILNIENDLYRKRLSRARFQMEEFLGKQCSLASSNNPCKCNNRIRYMEKKGKIQSYLEYSKILESSGKWTVTSVLYPEIKKIRKVAEIYKNIPNLEPKDETLIKIQNLLTNNSLQILID